MTCCVPAARARSATPTLGLSGASAQAPAPMNVVVVVMDSLRVDHIYGEPRPHRRRGTGSAARACAS